MGGPQGEVAAVLVAVPGPAATGVPHRRLELGLQLRVVGVLRLAPDLERAGAVPVEGLDRLDDVRDLGLDHEDDAAVAEGGVRAEQQEQVGEAGDGGAAVRGSAGRLPLLRQGAALAAGQPVRDRDVHDPEAGAQDDHVDLVLDPVDVDDGVRAHLGDAAGDDVDVVLRDRRVVVVADQHALAADRVVGRQPGAQRRVRHLPLEVLARLLLGLAAQPALAGEGEQVPLAEPVLAGARHPLEDRVLAEQVLLLLAVLPVHPRQDPRRRALEHHQPVGLPLELRDELDRRGAGADDGDPLADQVDVVVPPRGVEDRPGEGPQARQVGVGRLDQAAAAADEQVGGQRAAAGLEPPERRRVVPGAAEQLGVEVQLWADAEVVADPLQVGPDLRLPAEGPRPVRVRREGERVEMAGHVAGATGIGVVAPGAADAAGPLEHHDVALARLSEPHGGPDAGEAAADHRHAHVAGEVRHGCSCLLVGAAGYDARGVPHTGVEGWPRRKSSRPRKRCRKRS